MRTIKLIPGLPTKRLVKTIRYHHRHGEASRRALAFYLLDMQERGEHKSVQCSSTLQFAVQTLELDPREAGDLLRVARALQDLPRLTAPLLKGKSAGRSLES